MLAFNDQAVLEGTGNISHVDTKTIAQAHCANFDQQRKVQEAKRVDQEDMHSLEALEQALKQMPKSKP